MSRLGLTSLLILVSGTWAAAQHEPPVPKELLERVDNWVRRFLADFRNCSAEETLEQTRWDRRGRAVAQRLIVSDYFVVRLPSGELAEFRDVLAVDGKTIRLPEQREQKWQRLAAARSRAEIAALFTDPGSYRLAAEHFANLALLVTRFAERHWDTVKYFFAVDTSDPPRDDTLVGYRQLTGEGLILFDGKPVFPSGQAWVDPNDGHIQRIEETFEHKRIRYWTAVELAWDDGLKAWLPREITVRVFEKGRMTEQDVYSYASFRRRHAYSQAGTEALRSRP